MNMEQLYNEMKAALTFFDLSFHQKDQVEVKIEDKELVFLHANRSIRLKLG